jgi:hypothetical protein
MSDSRNLPNKSHADPSSVPDEPSEGACRPTFYMSADLLAALEEQCVAEGDKKRSPFLAELLSLLLTSDIGKHMRNQARTHRRSLAHELECNLILFSEHLPAERIRELAKASQRHPDQMLIRLVLLGLRVYERAIARMDADIEASKENSLNL